MKNHFFYECIKKSIVQFLDAFNDIRIARYNDSGDIVKYIKVPIQYMHKDKVYYWLYQKDKDNDEYKKELTLPLITVMNVGMNYNEGRQVSRWENVIVEKDIVNNRISLLSNPVPYDIELQMTILGKNVIDVDQILEQILPFFTPVGYIRLYFEELDCEIDVKVALTSVSPDNPIEMEPDTYRIIRWELSFTLETYIFKQKIDPDTVTKYNSDGTLTREYQKTIAVSENVSRLYTDYNQWENRSTTSASTSTSASKNVITNIQEYNSSGGLGLKFYKKLPNGNYQEYDKNNDGLYIKTDGSLVDECDRIYVYVKERYIPLLTHCNIHLFFDDKYYKDSVFFDELPVNKDGKLNVNINVYES